MLCKEGESLIVGGRGRKREEEGGRRLGEMQKLN
jgi:hypothetical protein